MTHVTYVNSLIFEPKIFPYGYNKCNSSNIMKKNWKIYFDFL